MQGGGRLDRVVQQALDDAHALGRGDAQLLHAACVVWASGALGCPQPGMAYTAALVNGFRVELALGGETLVYHAGPGGEPFCCPAERREPPAAGAPEI